MKKQIFTEEHDGFIGAYYKEDNSNEAPTGVESGMIETNGRVKVYLSLQNKKDGVLP